MKPVCDNCSGTWGYYDSADENRYLSDPEDGTEYRKCDECDGTGIEHVTCDRCNGHGWYTVADGHGRTEDCDKCDGLGRVERSEV